MMLNNVNDLVKISSMNSRGLTASDLGKSPWQINQIRDKLRHFNAEKLQKTYAALLHADKACKGASADGGVLAFEDVLRVISS